LHDEPMRGRGSGQPAAGVVHCQEGFGPLTRIVIEQLHCPWGYEQSSPSGEQGWFGEAPG
jgi:hypothetical protein